MRGRRSVAPLFFLSMVLAVVTASAVMLPAAPAAEGDLLPDLGMARVSDLKVDTQNGRRLLRYSTEIANVGQGAFELHLRRATVNDPMTTIQRIYTASGFRDRSTNPVLVFAGDGHNHWHVRDLETVVLDRLDNGGGHVGTDAKVGFCFLDHLRFRPSLPGAPGSAVYTGCGTTSSLDVTMGLSVGWSDQYSWNLPDQYIDITGLKAGRYRLNVDADAGNWFEESNESNNTTWVDIQLKAKGAPRVLGFGPSV
jgi:lysyl oxidase